MDGDQQERPDDGRVAGRNKLRQERDVKIPIFGLSTLPIIPFKNQLLAGAAALS